MFINKKGATNRMKPIKLLASATLLAALTLSAGVSSDAAGTGTTADPAQGKATIKFDTNYDPTGPKDPTNPTEPNPSPLPDDKNEETGAPGPLSLDVYPSNFDFGTQKLDMNGGTYTSEKTGNHYLQVTDNRDKLGGWSIAMVRTEFSNGTDELTGSQLYIPAGEAHNSLASDPTAADTAISVSPATGQDEFDTMHEIGTTESNLFGAQDDLTNLVGKGTTTYGWEASKELLNIPAGVAKTGTFTSTINWVLNATPMN